VKGFLLRFALFLLLLALFGELFFRYAVVASNTAYKVLDPEFRILVDDTSGTRAGTYTLGRLAELRVPWRVNRQGWKSAADYEPRHEGRKPVIALIGDSYIAGFQVEDAQHMTAVMEELLDHRWDVYSFGQGGSCCSQFLQVARYVRARFDPDVYVILCRDSDWGQSITQNARDKNIWQIEWRDSVYAEVPPRFRAAWYRRLPKHSALVRYFSYNVNLDLLGSFRGGWSRPRPLIGRRAKAKPGSAPPVRAAMEHVVGRLRQEIPDRPVVFMYDALRDRVYWGKPPYSAYLLSILKDMAAKYEIPVFDLAPVFVADWNERHEKFSFAIDDHWTEHGHRVVAQGLFDFLISEGIVKDAGAGYEDSH
jgi:hypothetical protein